LFLSLTALVFGHDKVSVLDGGLPRWIEDGGNVEDGPVAAVGETEGLPASSPATTLIKCKCTNRLPYLRHF
jgi:thiosulfate/3-mercaptopyruvate sulfurtransferase